MALITHALGLECFFRLNVLRDLELLIRQCDLDFMEVLLCVAPPLYKYEPIKPQA